MINIFNVDIYFKSEFYLWMKVLVLKNETRTLLPIYVRPHNIKSCNLSTREKEVFGKRKNNLTP